MDVTAHVCANLWGRMLLPHFLFTVLLLTAININNSYALPYLPDNPTLILESLPKTLKSINNEFSILRDQLKSKPGDIETTTKLANAYLSYGKRESDPRYIGYAQALLSKWWHQDFPPEPVHLLRANIKQYNHQFNSAITDLGFLVKKHPGNTQAWLTLSTLHLLLGDVDKSKRSCHAMARASNNANVILCLSSVLARTGQENKAEKLLLTLIRYQSFSDSAQRQWIYTSLAEINIQNGNTANADHYLHKALAIDIKNPYLLRLYIDYLINTQQHAEAFELIKHEKNDTALLIRAALLYKHFGKITQFEHYKNTLLAIFSAEALRGTEMHLREHALFELTVMQNPRKALGLAKTNWAIQHEPEDARILLNAALASNEKSALIAIKEWKKITGINDVRLNNKPAASI